MEYIRRYWLFALTIITVWGVDYFAGQHRLESVLEENKRDLIQDLEFIVPLVEAKGLSVLPGKAQEQWATMEVYAVDDSGHFATSPRKWGAESVTTRRRAGTAYGEVFLKGEHIQITEDYASELVLSAGKVATLPDGKRYAIMAEMDMWEVRGISASYWYAADEWAVLLFGLIALAMDRRHKRRVVDVKAIMADNTKLRNDITFLRTSQHENIDPFGAGDSEQHDRMLAYFAACKLSILCDKFGIITDVNHRMCLALGYREEELVGQPMRMVLPEDDEYNDHDAILQKFIETPFLEDSKLIESMVQARHKDGHLITLTLTRFVVPVWKGTQKTVYGGAVARVKGE